MPETSNDNNIDKVRELLFGNQMRDYEQRFVHLEERLIGEVGQVAASLETGLGNTEETLRQALAQQAAQQEQEHQQWQARSERLEVELQALRKELSGELTSRFTSLQQQMAEIQQQFDGQITLMQDRLQEHQAQLRQSLEVEGDRLEAAKLDRRDLAVLFEEISKRLRDDTDPAAAERAPSPESDDIAGG